MFDGDGSFNVQPERQKKSGQWQFSLRVSISLSFGGEALNEFVGLYGGSTQPDGMGGTSWILLGKEPTKAFILAVQPYLHIRYDSAHWYLQALDRFPKSKTDRRPGERWPASVWYPERLADIAAYVKEINKRERKTKKPPKIDELIDDLDIKGYPLPILKLPSNVVLPSYATPSYLGGLFDAEGSFSIQVRARRYKDNYHAHFGPCISINLFFGDEVLDFYPPWLAGGKVRPRNKLPGRQFNISVRNDLILATNKLLPYLHIKGKPGERFLQAIELFPKERKNHRVGERTWDDFSIIEQIADIAKNLNQENARRADPAKIDEAVAILKREYDREKELQVVIEEPEEGEE